MICGGDVGEASGGALWTQGELPVESVRRFKGQAASAARADSVGCSMSCPGNSPGSSCVSSRTAWFPDGGQGSSPAAAPRNGAIAISPSTRDFGRAYRFPTRVLGPSSTVPHSLSVRNAASGGALGGDASGAAGVPATGGGAGAALSPPQPATMPAVANTAHRSVTCMRSAWRVECTP